MNKKKIKGKGKRKIKGKGCVHMRSERKGMRLLKNSCLAKNVHFVKDLTNPKFSTCKRRDILCQVIQNQQTGKGKLRAIKEVITNINRYNIKLSPKDYKKFMKHKKALNAF